MLRNLDNSIGMSANLLGTSPAEAAKIKKVLWEGYSKNETEPLSEENAATAKDVLDRAEF